MSTTPLHAQNCTHSRCLRHREDCRDALVPPSVYPLNSSTSAVCSSSIYLPHCFLKGVYLHAVASSLHQRSPVSNLPLVPLWMLKVLDQPAPSSIMIRNFVNHVQSPTTSAKSYGLLRSVSDMKLMSMCWYNVARLFRCFGSIFRYLQSWPKDPSVGEYCTSLVRLGQGDRIADDVCSFDSGRSR